MKYTFSELQDYFAQRRGFNDYDAMKAKDQNAADILINLILDRIWYHKQWGFNGDRMQFSFVPPLSGTVTGTAGEHEVTLGTAINTSYEGLKIRGQYILINSRLYKIIRQRSTTVLSLDSVLQSTVSGIVYTIYFLDYPLYPWIGAIRGIKRNTDDVTFLPEYMTEIDNTVGNADFAHLAGMSDEAFFSDGTISVTAGSAEFAHSATGVSKEHVGKALLLKKAGAYAYYKIVDVDTVNNKWIVDRNYSGSTETTLAFEIQPRGSMLLRFKSYPSIRELVEIKYTVAPDKLVNDDDVTLLPSDIPMIAGIEVVATQWESVGEGNINEVLFKDKKFKESLKSLNFRGSSLQTRMYSAAEAMRLRRWPRGTNPWNSWS